MSSYHNRKIIGILEIILTFYSQIVWFFVLFSALLTTLQDLHWLICITFVDFFFLFRDKAGVFFVNYREVAGKIFVLYAAKKATHWAKFKVNCYFFCLSVGSLYSGIVNNRRFVLKSKFGKTWFESMLTKEYLCSVDLGLGF